MKPSDLPPEFADRRFELAVKQLADDLRYGHDSSPYLGAGVDYVQSRPFVTGDSAKDIDWRVTARTGKFHVKEFESLKCTPAYVVMDTSASMAVASQQVSKFLLGTLLAGGVGLAAQRRLSPVGMIAAGGRTTHFRPSLNPHEVFRWLHALRRRDFFEPTQLAQRLDELAVLLTSRHLVIVISDMHDIDALDALKRIAARHDVMVLKMHDPAEHGQLRAGILPAREAETGHSFVTTSRATWLAKHSKETTNSLSRAGIDHLQIETNRPFLAALRRLLKERGGLFQAVR